MRAKKNCFSMCLDSDKKILHLCSKHMIAMSSRKSKEKYHQLVFSEVCLEHVQVTCWRSCLKFVLSSRFWFLAKLPCFNEVNQNVKDLVFRDKGE